VAHTTRFWANRYIGTLDVTLVGGRTLDVSIHKEGRTIWINKNIVHPSNEGSFNGIINEIGIIYQAPVEKWEWKTYSRHLTFR